jgi:elongation factor G
VEAMKVYGSNAIRNVAFVGHGGSGKTSLVDALAFVSGASRRHGSIKDGTTLTDYSPDEIERKHSINLALGYAEWLDTKLNLIDTPGYLDYFGEVVTGLHAADAAVVVLSGTGGVEVGTEKVWEVCDQLHLPRILFVSLMDKEHADFERVFQDVKAHLTPRSFQSRSRSATGTTSTGSSTCSPGTATSIRRAPRPGSTRWCRSRPSTRPCSSNTASS